MIMVKLLSMTGVSLDPPFHQINDYSILTDKLNFGPEVDWEPEHLATSAWLEHVPFSFWLTKALRPGCFVELGTERGVSYAAFCQAVDRLGLGTRCYAIDTWRGDDHAGHYDDSVYTDLATLNERRFGRFSSLLRMTFKEALHYFADGEIDLLHIDGLHTYDAVVEDFTTWRPKLSDRAVVLFHDINVRRDEFGVWRLWRELRPQFPHFEFVHGHGLGVLGVGGHLPSAIRALFGAEAQTNAKTAVCGLFAARGASVHRAYALQSAAEQAQKMAADVAALHNEIATLRNQAAILRDENATRTSEAARSREETISVQAEVDRLRQQSSVDNTTIDSLRNELADGLTEAASLRDQLAASALEADALRTRLAREVATSREALVRHEAASKALVMAARAPAPANDDSQNIIEDLRARLALAEARCEAFLTSTSWRITAPMRLVKVAVTNGPVKWKTGLQGREPDAAPPSAPGPEKRCRDFPPSSQVASLQLRVLIVAELSIPQCKKYRVDQKHDMIKALGWDCSIVSWKDTDRAINLIQTHSLVIFYRVPAFANVLRCIDEADSLGLPIFFELDDLIFDLDDYGANPNLLGLDAEMAKGLFHGAILYRQALERCRNIIASTHYLADRMQAAGGGSATIIENALDIETIHIAATARPRPLDGKVRILYGSGTRTHDADFASVAPALRRVAEEHPEVEIVLVGELNPPEYLTDLNDRLWRLPVCPYPEYLALVATSDIAIAPLSPVRFNDAKSNIKFLEAAVVGVASVCSPRSAFIQAIRQNETGLLADGINEWYDALTALVVDPELRGRIGEAARKDVAELYSPDAIGRRQLRPLLSQYEPAPDPRLHILEVNILFRPQSFGGATIVMEELVRQLHGRTDTRVSVFTSAPAGWIATHAVERAEEDGVTIFRIGLQDRPGWFEEAWDETTAEAFREVLRALRPDVVHFHAIQGIGAAVLQVCQSEGIPSAVTLHDAWWLCERQFLVTGEGKYCGQQKINLNVCATCVANIGVTVIRNLKLRQALECADLLLTPSQHWRRFYLANGFDPERVKVNENGIPLPTAPTPNQGPRRLRFGFVAGAEAVKGFPLLKRTFEALERDDWELVLVNHGLAVGMDSYAGVTWKARGTITVVPPFAGKDRDAFYQSIDVLLFPSQWPESFGLTVREALTRNKWVIATDQGGAAEAIKPGINGTLIPITTDIAPFVKAVTNLLDRKPDLAGWVNPSAHRIRDFATQAVELRDILASVASRTVAGQTDADKRQAAD